MTSAESTPGEHGDHLATALKSAQKLLFRYPDAAQAFFAAVVAEGRTFAETPEGRELSAKLEGSDLIRRGRVIWEVATLNVLREEPDGPLPTHVLDAFARLLASPELEPELAELFGLGRPAGAATSR